MGIRLENAKLKPLCFDLRRGILYLFLAVICRFLSTSQFYNFYDTKIRITPLSRPCVLHRRTAGKHQLAFYPLLSRRLSEKHRMAGSAGHQECAKSGDKSNPITVLIVAV